MSSQAVTHIHVSEVDDPAQFSVLDEALGKLSPTAVEVRFQDKLFADASDQALKKGFRSLSAYIRACVAKDTYGEDGVRSLVEASMKRHGFTSGSEAPASTPAPTRASTPASTGPQGN